MSESHTVNLSKQTLSQLQELLERQQTIMKNKKLLQRLKDKGESVIQLHDKILREIQQRQEMKDLATTLSSLSINCSNAVDNAEFLKEKHVKYVCSKEKPIADRYRPHRMLVHKQSTPDKSPKKEKDVTAASEPKLLHEPTKLIPLSESLLIENEQAHRVLEEKAKKALNSLASELLENDNDAEDTNENEAIIDES